MSLQVLDLSHNNLQGAVPDLSLYSNLQQLYLDYNNISGYIPYGYGYMGSLRCWSLDHNPGVCGDPPSGSRCLNPLGTNISECLAMLHYVTVQYTYVYCSDAA